MLKPLSRELSAELPDVLRNRIVTLDDAGFVVLNLHQVEGIDIWLCGCAALSCGSPVPIVMALMLDSRRRSAIFRGLNQIPITPKIHAIIGLALDEAHSEILANEQSLLRILEKTSESLHQTQRSDAEREPDSAPDLGLADYN